MDTYSYLKKVKTFIESNHMDEIDLSESTQKHHELYGYFYAPKKEDVLICSNEFWQMIQIKPKDYLPFDQLLNRIHPDDIDTFASHHHQAMHLGKPVKLILRLRVDDIYLWHEWVYHIDSDQHQIIEGLYGTLKNVDDFISLKYKSKALEAKLLDLETKHNETYEQLRLDEAKKSQSKMMFLSNMSHEIRTPMNAIIGFANLLNHKTSTSEQKDYIEKIKDASNHLLEIINDILDYSKIESGKITIEHETFKLDKLFEDVKSMVHEHVKKKNLYLDIETIQCPNLLKGDVGRIRQILLNLVSNAVKFTDHGGISIVAYVESQIDSNHLRLAMKVKDTGIGMTLEQQKKIFNDFEQADIKTSRLYGGTGLGLSISKRLSELMGGTISLESKLNEGSEFTLFLPLELSKDEDVLDSDEDLILNKPKEGAHILVAEDNFLSQKLAHRILTNLGMNVTLANHGKIACDLAKSSHFDLIILDVMMPVMDGIEAAKEIRKNDEKTPIIAMTASVFEEDIRKCLEAGMNDHISKPIDPKSLYKALSMWIPSLK